MTAGFWPSRAAPDAGDVGCFSKDRPRGGRTKSPAGRPSAVWSRVLTLPLLAIAATLAATIGVQAQGSAFAAADKNGDGSLDKAEFRTFIDLLAEQGVPNAVKVKSSGRYDFAFSRVDKNGDGRITPEELSAMK